MLRSWQKAKKKKCISVPGGLKRQRKEFKLQYLRMGQALEWIEFFSFFFLPCLYWWSESAFYICPLAKRIQLVMCLCCCSVKQQGGMCFKDCPSFSFAHTADSNVMICTLVLSSVLIHCSVLIQELIEHLVSCFRHLAHVAPSPVAFSGKRDHQRRLIDPFVNEGLQNVNDESGSLWMWTWFIYSSH